MARNRQRAKERKQRQQGDSGLPPLDDDVDAIVPASLAGGAPPADLGTVHPVDFDDDGDAPADVGPGAGDIGPAPVPRKRGKLNVIGFVRACWAELQRVQWPDRRQVGQATAVVLGFVVIAGAYLGLADALAQRIVNLIL